jgi:hypothetical protein
MSSTIVEMLSGILRLFPNTMAITMFVVGMTTGKIAWILAAIGGILVVIAIGTIQYLLSKVGLGDSSIPGFDVVEACSLIPPMKDDGYVYTPSLWASLTTFFLTYILVNAVNVYTAPPGHGSNKDVIGVQQRKGIGIVSIFAVVILFLFLMAARYYTQCEKWYGMIFGAVIGAGIAYGWWRFLGACGADVFPDIHGMMVGLGPADLRAMDRPIICLKK